VSNYPDVYQTNNQSETKFLNVVVEIEDSPYLFSLVTTYTKIRYGDPDINYGDGYVYGGYRVLDNVKPYLSIESNLKLSQKIEPEQGRGSAGSMSLVFVDVNGFMTNFISPGKVLDEPIGGKQVKVWVGYAQSSSFKEDYFVVFRGYITATKVTPTKVIMELTDANIKRKQQAFYTGKSNIRSIAHNFLPTDVNTTSDTITIPNHGFQQGYIVQFSGASLANPLTSGTDYYVTGPTTNTFALSTTLNGPTLNLLTQGVGTQSVALTDIGPYATVIPLNATEGFSVPITGPDGTYDTTIKTYVQIGDESMLYSLPSQITTDTITVVRGSRGTAAVNHAVDDDVSNSVEIQDNLITASLKMMLSGWGTPWKSSVQIRSFGATDDPLLGNLPAAIVLPDGVSAIEDYGLAPGDFIYVTGSGSNDGTYTVLQFEEARGYPNNVIVTNEPTTVELSTLGVMALRSQYDTYPVNCGSQLRPTDVDVPRWQNIQRNFVFQNDCTFRVFITSPISVKEFIEKEFLLPAGCYGITRFGRIAVSATKPPVAGEELVVLGVENVINPQNIMISRSSTTRTFYNEVQYYYDFNDQGEATSVAATLDSNSISLTTISSVLPINSLGLKTDLGAATFIQRRGLFILRRYQDIAVTVQLQTNWQAGSVIQVSDIVALYDDGTLKLSNLQTGERDLGVQLYEVINWELDIKSGTANLTLLTQLDFRSLWKYFAIFFSGHRVYNYKASFTAKFWEQVSK
jgi:hypothetical protein